MSSPGKFQHGLLGCFSNIHVCCCSWICPCVVQGKVARKVGDSCILCGTSFCIPLLNIFTGGIIRAKVREQRGIKGGVMKDMLCCCLCPCCVLAQEAVEVNAFEHHSRSVKAAKSASSANPGMDRK